MEKITHIEGKTQSPLEMYTTACTIELRNLLTAWESIQLHPRATKCDYDRVRAKINGLCDILDKIEKQEIKQGGI